VPVDTTGVGFAEQRPDEIRVVDVEIDQRTA
jgi:hypothetical protein